MIQVRSTPSRTTKIGGKHRRRNASQDVPAIKQRPPGHRLDFVLPALMHEGGA